MKPKFIRISLFLFLSASILVLSVLFVALLLSVNSERTILDDVLILDIYNSDETRSDRIIDSFTQDLDGIIAKFLYDTEADSIANIENVAPKEFFFEIIPEDWIFNQLDQNIEGLTKFLKNESTEFKIKISVSELIVPVGGEIKKHSESSGLYDNAVRKILLGMFTITDAPHFKGDFQVDLHGQSILNQDVCKTWFAKNYENTIDLISEYLVGNQTNLYVFWDFTECADEIFDLVSKSLSNENTSRKFYRNMLELIFAGYFDQKISESTAFNSLDFAEFDNLIVESLIQSYEQDWTGVQSQIIFNEMKPYFFSRSEGYSINVSVVPSKEKFRHALQQKIHNDHKLFNQNLNVGFTEEIIDSILNITPVTFQKSPHELRIVLETTHDFYHLQIVEMLELLSLDGFLLIDELNDEGELVDYLRFAKEISNNGFEYNIAQLIRSQNIVAWNQLNLFRETIHKIHSYQIAISIAILLFLMLDFYVIRVIKFSWDQSSIFLVFLMAVLLFSSLSYVALWNFILLDIILSYEKYFEGISLFPAGFEQTYQILHKEMFGIFLDICEEFHNRMINQFALSFLLVSSCIFGRVAFLRFLKIRRSMVFCKRLH